MSRKRARDASTYRAARRNAARGNTWRKLRDQRKALGMTRSEHDRFLDEQRKASHE